MTRPWTPIVELFSIRESGTGLALFRMAVAAVVIGSLLSAAQVADIVWIDQADGGYRQLKATHWLLSALGGPTSGAVWGVFAVSLTAATAMLLGVGGPVLGRLVALVTQQTYLTLVSVNGDTMGGYDNLIVNALWLLVIADATATLSLTARLKRGDWASPAEINAFPRFLAIFQIVVVYGFTGWQKLSAVWTPAGGYSALYWVFQEPTWPRYDIGGLTASLYPLTQALTAVTWHWETAFPLLLLVYYYRYTHDRPGRLRKLVNRHDWRLFFAGLGVGMHLGIIALLNVGPFSYISLAYYICLFTPAEIEEALRRGKAYFAERLGRDTV